MLYFRAWQVFSDACLPVGWLHRDTPLHCIDAFDLECICAATARMLPDSAVAIGVGATTARVSDE